VEVKPDPVAAAKWHLLARESGISDARLDVFLAGLNEKQREQAEAAARQWRTTEMSALQ